MGKLTLVQNRGGLSMSELDTLVTQELVEYRKKVLDAWQVRHPTIYAAVNAMLSGKTNRLGMQVTENNQVAGEYTFNLQGIHISSVDSGKLISEIHHPFLGVIKPYVIIDKGQIEHLVKDEELLSNVVAALPKYLPGLTIKFMQ